MRSALDERNEQVRLAYVERAKRDRQQLEGKLARKEPMNDDELAALALLSSGFRLQPAVREKLGLRAPIKIPPR